MDQPQNHRISQFFVNNEPVDYWLVVRYDGTIGCSCGADTLLLNSKTLIGCEIERWHGARNIRDVFTQWKGVVALHEMALTSLMVKLEGHYSRV